MLNFYLNLIWFMRYLSYTRITDSTPYGVANTLYVRINPKYKDNKAILMHEYTHVFFAYCYIIPGVVLSVIFLNGWFHIAMGCMLSAVLPALFRTQTRLGMWAEILAYRVTMQVENSFDNVDAYVKIIREHYNFKRYSDEWLKEKLLQPGIIIPGKQK